MNVLLFCLALIQPSAYAQLDQHQEQGLQDTKALLVNPQDRQHFINKEDKTGKAKDVDNKVDALAGSKQNKEEIYGIAADVMDKLTRDTNGDTKAMEKILRDAQSNPQGFYDKYFDEQAKARVRGVSSEIDKKGSVTAPPK